MSSITIRLNPKEKKYIQNYVKMNNKIVSEFVRENLLEKLEDEYDLIELEKAIKEFEKDKTIYTPEEAWGILGI